MTHEFVHQIGIPYDPIILSRLPGGNAIPDHRDQTGHCTNVCVMKATQNRAQPKQYFCNDCKDEFELFGGKPTN